MKTATIDDVAALAGVSRKTVSRVLNREPKVRPATRERIERAIAELRYQPNSPARRLAGRRTYLLGLMYNAGSSYVTSLQNGALQACRDEHFDLLIHPCEYDDPNLLDVINELVGIPKVDGLLLTPPIADVDEVRESLARLDVPYVLFSHERHAGSDWTVCTNDEAICVDVVAYLAGLGHRHFAFVRGHPDHKAMAKRHAGFIKGISESGLDVDTALVVQGDNSFGSGVTCGNELLGRSPRPTAIMCANDHMAAGVMHAIHEHGLQIPGNISVTGFDDIPLAHQLWPKLTTVRQPLEAMAREAARLLIARILRERPDDVNVVVDSQLVVRASTDVVSRAAD